MLNVAVKTIFFKKQEPSGILGRLGLKTPLSKLPYLGIFCFENNSVEVYKIRYEQKINLCQKCIYNNQDLLIVGFAVLVEH